MNHDRATRSGNVPGGGAGRVVCVGRQSSAGERPIYVYLAYEDQYAAVRQGDWKRVAYRSGKLELYNLAEDLGEKHDQAPSQPAKVKSLAGKLRAWEKEMHLEQYSGVK